MIYTYIKQGEGPTTTVTDPVTQGTIDVTPAYSYYFVSGFNSDVFYRIHIQEVYTGVYTYDSGFSDSLAGTYTGELTVVGGEDGTDAHKLGAFTIDTVRALQSMTNTPDVGSGFVVNPPL